MTSFRGSQSWFLATLVLLSCTPAEAGFSDALADAESHAPVRPGIAVLLSDSLHLLAGRRVGLITNHTGFLNVDGVERSTIDLLHEHAEVELVALYGPEHGLRGLAEAGEKVEDGRDVATGLPIFSLYGGTLAPSPEMLEGVETLVFDIQDIGTRYYTYVWTMALSMKAAADAGIPFVVLDRPNPIGGEQVQGSVLDPAFSSFVGLYAVPMRHGLTPGEMARWVNDTQAFGVDLSVVPAQGWTRDADWESTALPWRAPSPNMPTVISALHYPGTCLFEGTNLSVGRGTERAFEWVGAPFLDGEALAAELNALGLPGTRFEPARFTPVDAGDGKYSGQEVEGVRFVATDDAVYDPVHAAVATLQAAYRMAGSQWSWRDSHFDRLAGTDRLRLAVEGGDPTVVDALLAEWDRQAADFRAANRQYLIYP